MVLETLFNEIAAAIHEKDGKSDGIVANDFPARIRAIPTGIGGIQIESIEITTPPTKTVYTVGETFDPAGMVVIARYSNGQTMNVNLSNLTFDPSGPLGEGTTSVTVNFQWGLKIVSTYQSISVIQFEWWSPQMTSDNSPAPFIASASSEFQSSSGYGTFYAYFAFDGLKDQVTTNASDWYGEGSTRWIQIDLGKSIALSGVRLYPSYFRSSFTAAFPKQFTISGSQDGISFTDFYTSDYSATYDINSHSWCVCLFNETVSYRYFRFSFMESYGAVGAITIVSDIQFFGEKPNEGIQTAEHI